VPWEPARNFEDSRLAPALLYGGAAAGVIALHLSTNATLGTLGIGLEVVVSSLLEFAVFF
jgi:hypothetical protein